jgi:hypothetical protein
MACGSLGLDRKSQPARQPVIKRKEGVEVYFATKWVKLKVKLAAFTVVRSPALLLPQRHILTY